MQPIFYFSTTVAWVDDDALFLKAMSVAFEQFYTLKLFQSPQEAIEFFESYTSPLAKIPFLHGRIQDEYYETLEHTPVDFNVLSLNQLAQHEKRFQEVSVLIVDLNMPNIDGIELLKKLRHLPMKKILLTGDADYQKAVAAFNDNLIDRFIPKDAPLLNRTIREYIQLLNQEYFCEYSKSLLAHLEAEKKTPMSDPIWNQFFESWRQHNEIKEYYLIDKTGSFLCMNQQDEQFYFIVHTDDTLNNFIQVYQEEESVEFLMEAIRMREKIPFFGVGKEAWQFENDTWSSHFYSCETLQGRELYYWHVIAI